MPHTPPSPAINRPNPTPQYAAAAAPAAELSLEDRLTLIDAAMTVRLDEAVIEYQVNTAHIDTAPVDLADVITGPVDTAPTPLLDLYPTPVAALLHRAHHRLLTDGRCTNVLVDHNGARCLLGALHIEARGDYHLEHDAVTVLLDAIRRQFGDDIDVPTLNDAFGTGRVPIRTVAQAASLADARSL
ncbi:hypothetical protein [Streptomyces sp. NPDC059122]|uniref:DUF6197 family protein n=1 Tax=Streptomyces sp. NPDC059122 TaxID=3346732 RepID=UPI0036B44437